MRIVSSILVVVLAVFVSAPALADEPEPDRCDRAERGRECDSAPKHPPADALRERGTVVLDDVVGGSVIGGTAGALGVTLGWFTLQSSTAERDQQRSKSTLFRFAPSADFFVASGLSLGGLVGISRSVQSTSSSGVGGLGSLPSVEQTSTSREIAPRVGYAFRLSDDLVFWPRVHVGYAWADTDVNQPGVGFFPSSTTLASTSSSTWSVGGDASLLFVLGRHAAIAAGPQLAYSRSKSDDSSATSLDLTMRASLRIMF